VYISKVKKELTEVVNYVTIVREMLLACETPQQAKQVGILILAAGSFFKERDSP